MSGKQALGGGGVGEFREWMMQQDDAQTGKRLARWRGQMVGCLIFSQEEAAFVGVVAVQPRSVETDDVNWLGPAGEVERSPVAEAFGGEFGAVQFVFHPISIRAFTFQDGVLPALIETKGLSLIHI